MKIEKGVLLVISGPSGAGKGTLVREVLNDDCNTTVSVSMTTRKPRPGEEEGISYFFRTKEEFEEEIKNDSLLEYACYAGNYYGTPKANVEELLVQGKNVILEIETQGAFQVKKKNDEAVLIFVTPSDPQEIDRRLHKRATESEEVIAERMRVAQGEYKLVSKYNYVVINDDLDDAKNEVLAIIKAEKCKQRISNY